MENLKDLNDRENERMIKFSPFEKIDFKNVSKSICKIKIEEITQGGISISYGTGFLLKFFIEQERFYCLITNEHVITNDIIKSQNDIFVSYDCEFKNINIKLDPQKRYIRSFIDIGLDISVVEILDEDNISKDYFLKTEREENIINKLVNRNIYIPQYTKGEDLVSARGPIIKLNKYEFTHKASTQPGSSGSPIFFEKSIHVIGIHKAGSRKVEENYGDCIYPIFNIIKNDVIEKGYNGRYLDGK